MSATGRQSHKLLVQDNCKEASGGVAGKASACHQPGTGVASLEEQAAASEVGTG